MSEVRLIDANALSKRLKDLDNWCRDLRKPGIEQARCMVHEAPIIDAVEVVRCYECQHSFQIPEKHSKRIDTGEMMACKIGRGNNDSISHLDVVSFDGYCDEGERKEAADGRSD